MTKLTEAQITSKALKARADKAGKLGTKFTAEANDIIVKAFQHVLTFGDDTIIGHCLDRLGPALNRRQVDAWASAFTNLKWNKKEGTYKKPKGKAVVVNAAAMEATPYYSFKKQNEVPDAFNIPAAFLAFITKARLETEAAHAIDNDGILDKIVNAAKDMGMELKETVPTAESLAKLKARIAPVVNAEALKA